MADSPTGHDPAADEAGARRWSPRPRAGASFAIAMAVWGAVLSLMTGCFVILVLLLDAHARRWEGLVVFCVGLFTVLFFGWAIYSTVREASVAQTRIPAGPQGTAASGDVGPGNASPH